MPESRIRAESISASLPQPHTKNDEEHSRPCRRKPASPPTQRLPSHQLWKIEEGYIHVTSCCQLPSKRVLQCYAMLSIHASKSCLVAARSPPSALNMKKWIG